MKKRIYITIGLSLIFLGLFLMMHEFTQITGYTISNFLYSYKDSLIRNSVIIILGVFIFALGNYEKH